MGNLPTTALHGRGHAEEWATQGRLAVLLGVSSQHFRAEYRGLVPGEAVRSRGPGKAVEIHGPTLFAAIQAKAAAVALKAVQPAPDADPLLSPGSDSPQLERYRAAKADLAELDLAQRKGALVDVVLMNQQLRGALEPLRAACETLQRSFGSGAYEILANAVEEAAERIAQIGEQFQNDAAG